MAEYSSKLLVNGQNPISLEMANGRPLFLVMGYELKSKICTSSPPLPISVPTSHTVQYLVD